MMKKKEKTDKSKNKDDFDVKGNSKKSPDQEKDKIQELTSTLKMVQADFENYKKRIERDRKDIAKYSGEGILKKFLPIVDNLELALKHAKNKDEFYQGVELIYASIREMLENEGVTSIPAIGLPFDPHRHEALMSTESDKPANTVLEVMQNGYSYFERVLRPAKVVVSKKKGVLAEKK